MEVFNAKENDLFGLRLPLALNPCVLVILSISSWGIEHPLALLKHVCHSYSRISMPSLLSMHANDSDAIRSPSTSPQRHCLASNVRISMLAATLFMHPLCSLTPFKLLYDLGFSFFSFHSADNPTPETLTTLNRTPGISPFALPFRPNPASSTSSFSSTKFKQPSFGTVNPSVSHQFSSTHPHH